jgi:hypothetical protein
MNWEAVGAIGEITAAVTVVASLIFVGYQLRQGQRSDRAAGQRDIHKQAREWYVSPRTHPGLFEVIAEVLQDWDGAPPEKQVLFDTWAFDYLLLVEQVMYMHRDGFINDASSEGFVNVALAIMATPGGAQWWLQVRQFWGQDAVEYLESQLAEKGGDIPPFDETLSHFGAQFRSMKGRAESSAAGGR